MPNPTLTLGALRMVAEPPAAGTNYHRVDVHSDAGKVGSLEMLESEWLSLTKVAEVVEAARAFVHAERHEDGNASWSTEEALFKALDSLAAAQEKNNG